MPAIIVFADLLFVAKQILSTQGNSEVPASTPIRITNFATNVRGVPTYPTLSTH